MTLCLLLQCAHYDVFKGSFDYFSADYPIIKFQNETYGGLLSLEERIKHQLEKNKSMGLPVEPEVAADDHELVRPFLLSSRPNYFVLIRKPKTSQPETFI